MLVRFNLFLYFPSLLVLFFYIYCIFITAWFIGFNYLVVFLLNVLIFLLIVEYLSNYFSVPFFFLIYLLVVGLIIFFYISRIFYVIFLLINPVLTFFDDVFSFFKLNSDIYFFWSEIFTSIKNWWWGGNPGGNSGGNSGGNQGSSANWDDLSNSTESSKPKRSLFFYFNYYWNQFLGFLKVREVISNNDLYIPSSDLGRLDNFKNKLDNNAYFKLVTPDGNNFVSDSCDNLAKEWAFEYINENHGENKDLIEAARLLNSWSGSRLVNVQFVPLSSYNSFYMNLLNNFMSYFHSKDLTEVSHIRSAQLLHHFIDFLKMEEDAGKITYSRISFVYMLKARNLVPLHNDTHLYDYDYEVLLIENLLKKNLTSSEKVVCDFLFFLINNRHFVFFFPFQSLVHSDLGLYDIVKDLAKLIPETVNNFTELGQVDLEKLSRFLYDNQKSNGLTFEPFYLLNSLLGNTSMRDDMFNSLSIEQVRDIDSCLALIKFDHELDSNNLYPKLYHSSDIQREVLSDLSQKLILTGIPEESINSISPENIPLFVSVNKNVSNIFFFTHYKFFFESYESNFFKKLLINSKEPVLYDSLAITKLEPQEMTTLFSGDAFYLLSHSTDSDSDSHRYYDVTFQKKSLDQVKMSFVALEQPRALESANFLSQHFPSFSIESKTPIIRFNFYYEFYNILLNNITRNGLGYNYLEIREHFPDLHEHDWIDYKKTMVHTLIKACDLDENFTKKKCLPLNYAQLHNFSAERLMSINNTLDIVDPGSKDFRYKTIYRTSNISGATGAIVKT